MALKDFKTLEFKERELSKFQDNVTEFSKQFNKILLDGVFLNDVVLSTTTNQIAHGLGRKYQGFIITNLNAGVMIWRDATVDTNQEKFLPLKASAAVTVSLWVF
jgi:hypothetical protein